VATIGAMRMGSSTAALRRHFCLRDGIRFPGGV
jgi:hypothetical protein